MDEGRISEGGRMCGAVRYAAGGEPFWVGHCHCERCRSHTGAPFVAFKKDQVAFTKGKRQIYNSTPGVERAFRGRCGTPMTREGQSEVPASGHLRGVSVPLSCAAMLNYDMPLWRPPSEGNDLIIRATIGRGFNRCSFCPMYTKL